MQFKLRESIGVASLLSLLTVDCLSSGDSPKEWMPETAGAGRALVWIPRDHLVYKVESLRTGVRYRILQTFQDHVSTRLIHAPRQINHSDPIGNVVSRLPGVWYAAN